MKKVILLLVIAVLFSLSACMKFELPQEKTTTEQGSNKDTNGKTDKTEDQPAKPDPDEEEFYGTGVKLTPKSEYEKIPLASMPVLGDQTLPESYMLPIPDWTGSIDQGPFGTCLANSIGMSLTIEVSNKKRKIPYEQRDLAYFSPAFLYSLGRLPGNCASAGMTVDGAMEVVKTYGVCPIKYMPYNKQVCPSARPSAEAYKIASKTKIRGYQRAPLEEEKLKQLVYSGKPVLLVVEVNNGFKKAFFKGGFWRRGSETPKGDNLHAILLTGYTPTALIALNSWGPGASGRGIISISPEMLGDFVLQAYIMDTYQSYPPLDNIEDQEDTSKNGPQTIQVDQSELKFETTTIGQKTAKVLQITMTSGEDTQLSLKLSDPNFEVVEEEINLFKNKKKAIQVFYIPKTPASHTGTLTISSPAGYLYEVRLYGNAKEKEPERDLISLNTNYVDFGSIQIDQTSTKQLTITNEGNVEATLSLSIEGEGVYSLPNRQIILPSGARKTIHIRFYPNRAGSYGGRLLLRGTHGFEQTVLLKGIANEKENQEDHRDNDRGDNHHDDRDQRDNDRDQQRGTAKYIVKEERPKVNLEADYCGRGSMGITYAGVIGIDEQGSVVRDLGSQLEVKIKVIKIDDNKIFTHNGEIFHKNGKNFCTKIFDSNTYNGGSSAIYTKTFKVNKGDEDNTVWILCVSNNGYRFYTKVHVIEQR
jgi:lipoprotein